MSRQKAATTDRKPGRPRSEHSQKAVLDATARLMDAMPIRQITIERIAKEAGVGKPTIYRWWEGKCEVVMDAFLAETAPRVPFPKTGPVVEALEVQAKRVIKLLRGHAGRIVAELVGEGQSNPHVMGKFRERFFSQLLAPARAMIEHGKENGELDPNLDTDLALDLIYGPIYYRLLVGHQPLDAKFAKALPKRVRTALEAAGQNS